VAEMFGGTPLLLALPWLALVVVGPLALRRRLRITSFAPLPAPSSPLVSVVVPARNEAVNISACVTSLLNTQYPNLEIVVVDDGSTDGTGDIVRILAEHAGGRLQLVEGAPLPQGWLGKPWACWQGFSRTQGELVLFTDADTRHDDALLGHAVSALEGSGAAMVTVLPRQLMISFWERLILPHVFTVLFMRYHDLARVNRSRNPADVIANGQFILVRRADYLAIGGHEALRREVVEDQRLAQLLVRSGRRMFAAHAHDIMDTRMYRDLPGIVEGWSKNLALGSRAAAPSWISPAIPWLIAAYVLLAWVFPPAALVAGTFTGAVTGAFLAWSIMATAAGLLFWAVMLLWMRVPPVYAVGYPLGALMTAWLFVRSAVRGNRVAWKGRQYDMAAEAGEGRP
jgi:chlorobactene glucosyltransferase